MKETYTREEVLKLLHIFNIKNVVSNHNLKEEDRELLYSIGYKEFKPSPYSSSTLHRVPQPEDKKPL